MKKSKQPVLFGILLCVLLLAAAAILYLIFGQKGKPEAPQIGLCFRSCAENPAYCDTLQQTLTGAGYDVHVADGANDQSLQTAQIGEMVEKGCALLVIEPVMVSTSDRLVEQVMEAQMQYDLLTERQQTRVLNADRLEALGALIAENKAQEE